MPFVNLNDFFVSPFSFTTTDRYLCFFVKGKKIIITNAFIKKTDKLPKDEIEQALKVKNSFEERVKQGDYYHEEET